MKVYTVSTNKKSAIIKIFISLSAQDILIGLPLADS